MRKILMEDKSNSGANHKTKLTKSETENKEDVTSCDKGVDNCNKDEDNIHDELKEDVKWDPREFADWQHPLRKWLSPVSEWRNPMREWQAPLREWQVPGEREGTDQNEFVMDD